MLGAKTGRSALRSLGSYARQSVAAPGPPKKRARTSRVSANAVPLLRPAAERFQPPPGGRTLDPRSWHLAAAPARACQPMVQAELEAAAVEAASAVAVVAPADAGPAMAQAEPEADAPGVASAAPAAAPAGAGQAATEAGSGAVAEGAVSAAPPAAPACAGQAAAQAADGRRPCGTSSEAPDVAAGGTRPDPTHAAPGTARAGAVPGDAPGTSPAAQPGAASREAAERATEMAPAWAMEERALLPLAPAMRKAGHGPELMEAEAVHEPLHIDLEQALPAPGPVALLPAVAPAPAPLGAGRSAQPLGSVTGTAATPAAAGGPTGKPSPNPGLILPCQAASVHAQPAGPGAAPGGSDGQLVTQEVAGLPADSLPHVWQQAAGWSARAVTAEPLRRGSDDELPTWNGAKFRAVRARSTCQEALNHKAQDLRPGSTAAAPACERVPTWRQATLGGGLRGPLRDARSDSSADSGDSDWRPAAERSDPDDDAAWESEPGGRQRGRSKAAGKAAPRRCIPGGDTMNNSALTPTVAAWLKQARGRSQPVPVALAVASAMHA